MLTTKIFLILFNIFENKAYLGGAIHIGRLLEYCKGSKLEYLSLSSISLLTYILLVSL